MPSVSFKESEDIDTSRPCLRFALFSSYDVGNCIGQNPEFATVGHPKGLTDNAVTDILINSDSEEDFGSDSYELSGSESECESQRGLDVEDKLQTGNVDVTTVRRKQRLGEWKLNTSCSSHDKPTKKAFFCAVPGINGNI
jgi:hypothetical protein